jgi:hypothetical protein
MRICLWKAYGSHNIALRFRAGMWWFSTLWFILSQTRISKVERLRFRRSAVIIPHTEKRSSTNACDAGGANISNANFANTLYEFGQLRCQNRSVFPRMELVWMSPMYLFRAPRAKFMPGCDSVCSVLQLSFLASVGNSDAKSVDDEPRYRSSDLRVLPVPSNRAGVVVITGCALALALLYEP